MSEASRAIQIDREEPGDDLFALLESTLQRNGVGPAIALLCETLRARKDYARLFYALLLEKRVAMGVDLDPRGPAAALPTERHAEYEDAIRAAGRTVGGLFLEQGEIARAWIYFRMIDEPQPIVDALERFTPKNDEDVSEIIELAYRQGLHPRKGFDLVLEHYGTCSAITLMEGDASPRDSETQQHCVRALVRALHRELTDRVGTAIEAREGTRPRESSVLEWIAARPWLFDDDGYHIDFSHLNAVVQMCPCLNGGAEMALARDLCAYGMHLSPRLRFDGPPPFEDVYADHALLLAVLAGDDVENGVQHFRNKVEHADVERTGTAPAEVLVDLLVRLNRLEEALEVARQHLQVPLEHRLSCPNVVDLCRRTHNGSVLAEFARSIEDPVYFLAGKLWPRQVKFPPP